ncbi:MAG: hypothetical protein AAGA54_14210 [Myxococcota bacterium]
MIVIGAGRVGGALAERAAAREVECSLVTRTDGWDAIEQSDAPIFVAVRNDDLQSIVDRIDPKHHGRLVFTQNGMLRRWLSAQSLAACTRGLLFFAVPSRGAPLEPGGDSPFVGPMADAVCRWLKSVEVPASTASTDAFAVTELEKLLWNCCFGLLCEHTQKPVGAIVDEDRDLLKQLVEELLHVGMPGFGLQLDAEARAAMLERLCAYSSSIPTYKGAVKEWPWRNGWFVDVAQEPGLHEDLLRKTGHLTQPTSQ